MVEDRYQKGAPPGAKQPDMRKVSMQGSEPAQTGFRPSPYQRPCPAGTPPPIPPVPPPSGGEPGYTELIQRILEQNETFRQMLVILTEIAKSAGTPPGQELQYYNTPLTAIQVVTPVQPNSPDVIANVITGTPGYQVEGIYNTLHRISPRITVINDGSDTLFVISTSDSTNWSTEAAILMGEARTFFNVWELRLRSPAAGVTATLTGGIYRVTEFDFWLAYSTNPNRSLFTGQRLAVPFPAPGVTVTNLLIAAGTLAPGATLLVPNGFTLSIRSYIYNAALSSVYVAGPIPAGVPANPPVDAVANVGVAGTRITLAPGDVARLFVRNTDSVAILGSAAGLFVDILVEQ